VSINTHYTDTPITQITSFLTGNILMSTDFLTCEQKARYGKFTEELGSDQLTKYFWLDDQYRMIIFQLQSDSNHLGFAIQLETVRFLGTFLSEPKNVPNNVSLYVA